MNLINYFLSDHNIHLTGQNSPSFTNIGLAKVGCNTGILRMILKNQKGNEIKRRVHVYLLKTLRWIMFHLAWRSLTIYFRVIINIPSNVKVAEHICRKIRCLIEKYHAWDLLSLRDTLCAMRILSFASFIRLTLVC